MGAAGMGATGMGAAGMGAARLGGGIVLHDSVFVISWIEIITEVTAILKRRL